MEPPPFGGGNLFLMTGVILGGMTYAVPSMEPPPFGGGNAL